MNRGRDKPKPWDQGWGGQRKNSGRTPPAAVPAEPAKPKPWVPTFQELEALVQAAAVRRGPIERTPENSPYRIAQHPKAATPPKTAMAMDAGLTGNIDWATQEWMTGSTLGGMFAEGLYFLGYAYLSELAQRTEYQLLSGIIAPEATRKWIRFKSTATAKKKENGIPEENGKHLQPGPAQDRDVQL